MLTHINIYPTARHNTSLLLAILACIATLFLTRTAQAQDFAAKVQQLEAADQSRIGIYALDTETGRTVTYRADERFPYCSTFKVLLAGEILRQNPINALDQPITYNQQDILSYAPITAKHVSTGMTLAEICAAAIRVSDNTAANLMLRQLGGPDTFQESLYRINDMVTRPVRTEPSLNCWQPGNDADTTTPHQLAVDLKGYTLGRHLDDQKRQILLNWMANNHLTDTLIRAGVPKDWQVYDKSGSGNHGTRNDIAMITRPAHAPLILVIMTTHLQEHAQSSDTSVAAAARLVASELTK